jgi:hypothetical protein
MGRSAARLLAAVLATAPLAAEELLTPGEQVMRELETALAVSDGPAAARLLAEVGEIFRHPASPEEARALLAAAGAATRSRIASVQAAALRAVGATGAPEGAALVEPFLRSLDVEKGAEPTVFAAVEAAGLLHPAPLVPALLRLAQGSPNLTLADQALVALGGYRDAPPDLRRQVAEKVLDLCDSMSRQRPRWQRLRAPGLRALQLLTGKKLNSVEMFRLALR